MTRHPITVTDRTRVADARALLRTHGIRGLPVTHDDGALVGVVTDRDLRETLTWLPLVAGGIPRAVREAIDDCEVGVLMHPRPLFIGPDAPLEHAAEMMRTQRVGGLPVLEHGELVGIITESDVLRAFEVTLGTESLTHRTVVDLHGGAPLWQHLKMLADAGNPATHVVVFRDRRGGHDRAVIRTAQPVG